MKVGDRIKWDETTHRNQKVPHTGTVTSLDGPFGRLEVSDDNGDLVHIQPSFVEEA